MVKFIEAVRALLAAREADAGAEETGYEESRDSAAETLPEPEPTSGDEDPKGGSDDESAARSD